MNENVSISTFNISGRKTKVKMLGRTNWSLKYQFLSFKKKISESIKEIQKHKAVSKY